MKTRLYLPLFVCLLVCIAGWTAYGQGQKVSPVRPAWDYKVVQFISANPDQYREAELYEDAAQLPTPANGALPKLKELGEQGWELVAVVNLAVEKSRTQTRYYFKRMK